MRRMGACGAGGALGLGILLAGCGTTPVAVQQRPNGPRTVLQANDAADGSMRWQVDLGPTDGATEPVLAGDTVIVASPDGATAYGLDDGDVRWSLPGAGLPAAVAGDLAVFDFKDRLEARHAESGVLAWKRATDGNLVQAHAGGPLALVVEKGRGPDPARPPAAGSATRARPERSQVALLDPATGQDRWTRTLGGLVDVGSSAVSARHILATYATDYSGRNTVAALRVADGRSEWTYAAKPVNAVTTTGDIPAVSVGLEQSRAETLDPRTGHLLWEAPEDDLALRQRLAPFLGQTGTAAFRRDPRTGRRLPGTVPAAYGVGAHGDLLVGADGMTLTALRGASRAWTADVARGTDPMTYLDLDDSVVVSVTAVGQERQGD